MTRARVGAPSPLPPPARWPALGAALAVIGLGLAPPPAAAQAPPIADFLPVTDAVLQAPAPEDWLWRRTLDAWGYSPLDQIDRSNVADLRLVWTRALTPGSQQSTPLAYRGVLYMPNPGDVIQAIDAATGDLVWEYRRDLPDDIYDHVGRLAVTNRNVAIYDRLIIDTSADNFAFALDAATGEPVWETRILDYRTHPATHSAGPIVASGKVISGRSCRPPGEPEACVITAHDALTGAELWRRRTTPAPGEPGDETWGGVPDADRKHVGSWMPPSYDPELNLIYAGTSVTSPAPKFMLGGADLAHLYDNSTLALDADTGEIVWHYQHLNDHWDLDHPFERMLLDTAVAPDPDSCSAATSTAGSARSTTRPARCCGNLGSPVTGYPISSAAGGRQYVAVSTGSAAQSSTQLRITPELRPSAGNNLFVFALPESPLDASGPDGVRQPGGRVTPHRGAGRAER